MPCNGLTTRDEETTMRFMVMVPGDRNSEAGILPDEKIFAAMGKFNDEMVKAGVLLAAEGLHPTSKGAKIRYAGSKTTVRDGPFTESKELIAGFWLIQVKSKQEAIDWMKRAPFGGGGGVEIEIRQVYELDELGPGMTPELKAQQERQQQQIASKKK
jgi:hypothetical protein